MTAVPAELLLGRLREEIAAAGLQRKAPLRTLGAMGAHLVLFAAGYAGFFVFDGLLARAAWMVVLLLGWLGFTTNTHMAAHGAVCESRRWNAFLTWFGCSFLSGISATYWKFKHNVLHHGMPNVDQVDPDHEFTPVFALADTHESRLGPIARRLRGAQGVLFPISTSLLLPNMCAIGLAHAVRTLRKDPAKRGAAAADLSGIAASFAFWFLLPLLFASPLEVLVFNAIRLMGLSLVFFVVFAPAHLPHEAVYYAKGAAPRDFLVRQAATTLNFRAGAIARFFISGLDRQIEHHLFPGVSHHRLPRMTPIVRRFFAEHGLPYRELGWGEALVKCVRVGFRPKAAIV